MGRAPIDVSRRVAGLLRQRRRELGWSLRQVEERAAELGVRLPTSTLVRIEQGKLDPGVRRLFTLLHVYNVEMLADVMELGVLAGSRIPTGTLEELSKEGESAWREGDIAEALAHFLAIREHEPRDAPERRLQQRALIAFATYARSLGKYRLARQLVDDLLRQPLERNDLVDVLVLAASVWRGLGSLEAALAMVERAAKRVGADDVRGQARLEHQWAKLLLEAGEPGASQEHLERSIDLYGRAADAYNQVRACFLRIDVLLALGLPDAAMQSAREALEGAERGSFGRLTLAARLELGRLRLDRGETQLAMDELRRGLASAVLLDDRRMQFFAHARLWKGHAALGEDEAAGFELRRAAQLAEKMDETDVEVAEVRAALRAAASVPGTRGPRIGAARGRPN